MRSRVDSGLPVAVAALVSSNGGTSAGGGGGGDPSSTSMIHLPRCTGEVRSATAVCISMLPWPRMPRRSSGSVTRRKFSPTMFGMR